MPPIDGSIVRAVIVLTTLVSATILAWHGVVDGQAYTGIVLAILGGAIHASGTKQGSEAAQAPPKE